MKVLVTFFLLLIHINGYSQVLITKAIKPSTAGPDTIQFETKAATSAWSITGTALDTSQVLQIHTGNITVGGKLTDAATDSAAWIVRLYAADGQSGNSFSTFAFIDSTIFTGETQQTPWVYTAANTSRPNYPYYYFTVQGTAANKTAAAVTGELKVTYSKVFR